MNRVFVINREATQMQLREYARPAIDMRLAVNCPTCSNPLYRHNGDAVYCKTCDVPKRKRKSA